MGYIAELASHLCWTGVVFPFARFSLCVLLFCTVAVSQHTLARQKSVMVSGGWLHLTDL